jgi:four helix bundle protein
VKTFRTLDLAVEFYQLVQDLEIRGNLKDQLQRAASSISLNLSEGNAKGAVNEKRHFFPDSLWPSSRMSDYFSVIEVRG